MKRFSRWVLLLGFFLHSFLMNTANAAQRGQFRQIKNIMNQDNEASRYFAKLIQKGVPLFVDVSQSVLKFYLFPAQQIFERVHPKRLFVKANAPWNTLAIFYNEGPMDNYPIGAFENTPEMETRLNELISNWDQQGEYLKIFYAFPHGRSVSPAHKDPTILFHPKYGIVQMTGESVRHEELSDEDMDVEPDPTENPVHQATQQLEGIQI